MNYTHMIRAALAATAISCTFAPLAHAQSYGYGGYYGGGTPFVPTYSSTIHFDLSAASSDALIQPNGAISMSPGGGYSGQRVLGTNEIRPEGLQWYKSSQYGPLTVVSDTDYSVLALGNGFSMTTVAGDSITFGNLSFDLLSGTVNGTIKVNNQVVLSDRIWNTNGGPLPTTSATSVQLSFSDNAAFAVSNFVNTIAPGSAHDQFQKALVTAPIGSLWVSQSVTSVPEPATYALMGLGLIGLLIRKRLKGADSATPQLAH